jgi:hypothetical protein
MNVSHYVLSLLDIAEHHNLKTKKYKFSVYVDTVKPVKLATLVSWAPVTVGHTFTEPANIYDIIHGHYTITGHLFVLNLGHTFPSSATMLCISSIPGMADMKNCKCLQMCQRNLLSPLSGFLNKPVQGLFIFPNEAGSSFLGYNT